MSHILVIDDLKENLALIEDAVNAFLPEFTPITAMGGQEGLSKALEMADEIDLVILDANMPDLDGFVVCEMLKADKNRFSAPILMLSAVFVDTADRVRGMNSGADGYLCKPYHIEELVAQIKVLVRIKRDEDALRAQEEHLQEELEKRTGDLRVAEERLRTLFEASPDAILVVNDQGIILDANPTAGRLYDKAPEALVQSTLTEMSPEADRAPLKAQIAEWFEGNLLAAETRVQCGESEVPVEIQVEKIQYGDSPALLLHIRNISKRMSMEKQLRSTQKMEAVGRLAGGVAHDFNNLLTSILGYSHLISEDIVDNPNLKNDIDQIIQSAERASSLTRQLLVFGRRQMLPLHPVNLNGSVEEIDHLLRRTIGEDIELVTLLGEDLSLVNADEGLLEQIIMNLAVNSRDALPQGGKLILETSKVEVDETFAQEHIELTPGEYVLMKVSDDGEGIPPEIIEQVYEPFFTTKNRLEGTGLGLSTVYGIVKHCKGFIDLKSEPGEGTVISIYFPAVPAGETTHQPPAPAVGAPLGTETILLVEDEDLVRQLTRRVLQSLGYTVLETRNGSEALALQQQHKGDINLVLSDIIMPQLGGPEMMKRMREDRPDMKILYMSGFTDDALKIESDQKVALLQKPFTKNQLAQKVRMVIDAG